MWLSKIDKHQLWNSKVEMTLWEIHNLVEKLGGSFEIENNAIIFRNPYTKTITINTIFCNNCLYKDSKSSSISMCEFCNGASEFKQKK